MSNRDSHRQVGHLFSPTAPNLPFQQNPGRHEPDESLRVVGDEAVSWRQAMANTRTNRGHNQDRARVAAGQDHEVRYEAGKTGSAKAEVKSAVKSAGNS